MDAETAKALAPVLGALVGGIVGAGGALFAAWLNRDTQLRASREAAMRAWRVDQINPLLSTAYEMYDRLVQVGAAAVSQQPEAEVPVALAALASDLPKTQLGHLGIDQHDFVERFKRLRTATNNCTAAAFELGDNPRAPEKREAFERALDELNDAIAAMVSQSERYIRDAR